MDSRRDQLDRLIETGALQPRDLDTALNISGIHPKGSHWRGLIDQLLLWWASLSFGCGLLFFVAFHWQDMHRFSQFALIQGCLIASVLMFVYYRQQPLLRQVSLTLAWLILGVLLALFGQTYQTGADPWQLFATWALLSLPWVWISTFHPLWLAWLGLINLSIHLYYQAMPNASLLLFSSDNAAFWLMFAFNAFALTCWEWISHVKKVKSRRWPQCLLALSVGIPISWLCFYQIVNQQSLLSAPAITWLTVILLLHYVYRYRLPDLFILAASCLSVIIMLTTWLAVEIFAEAHAESYLILALLVTGLTTAAVSWLRAVQKEWQE